MSSTAGSQRLLATVNATAVLRLLAELGPTARPELIRAAGISKTAVGNILDNLVHQGLVIRVGEDPDRRGPAAGVWMLNPTAAFSAAVDLGHRTASASIADFNGTILARAEKEVADVPSGDRIDTSVASDVLRLALEQARQNQPVPGLQSVVVGIPSLDVRLSQAVRAEIAAEIEEDFNAVVKILPSRFLAAHSEMKCQEAVGASSFVLLRIGGIAEAVMVIDGKVWRGDEMGSGSIRTLESWLPGISVLGTESIRLDAEAVGAPRGASAKDIFSMARDGDERALQVVQRTAERVAPIIQILQAVIDPQLLLLGGGIGANSDILLPAIRKILQEQQVAKRLRIEQARSIRDPVLDGAISTALEETQIRLFRSAASSPRTSVAQVPTLSER